MLIKNITTKVKIVHEALPELYLENFNPGEEQLTSLAGAGKEFITRIIEKIVGRISDQAYQALVNYFKARAAEFKQAQALPQDGVTIKIMWSNISGMAAIRSAINMLRGKLSVGNLMDITMPNIPSPEIQIVADKKFD
jgi:hypothetical protein